MVVSIAQKVQEITQVKIFEKDAQGKFLSGTFVGRPFFVDYQKLGLLVCDSWKQKAGAPALEECRKAFEAWTIEVNPIGKDGFLKRKDNGDYIWTQTCLAWEAWQAARNARAESPYPHVVTSGGSTSFCRLAESNSRVITEAQIEAGARVLYLTEPRYRVSWMLARENYPEITRKYIDKAKACIEAAQKAGM